MHSFRNYFIPLCIVSRYFMYLRDSWFFVFVFFPCENWVIRFGFVISHALQIYTVKLQWKRYTCKKCTLYKLYGKTSLHISHKLINIYIYIYILYIFSLGSAVLRISLKNVLWIIANKL